MKTVLFYSFKGGVGRTQTLLNVAKYLTQNLNKKVIMVDFDIYASGFSYLSNYSKNENQDFFLKYLVDLFEENEKKDIFVDEIDNNLFLIPAYNMQSIKPYHNLLTDLSQFLYSIKHSANEKTDSLSTVVDNIFNIIKQDIEFTGEYDYIFFDARTGITEVSDILFSQDVALKVIVSSYNTQNINGTNEILDILPKTNIKKHSILRVLSPKPAQNRELLREIYINANLDNNLDLKEKFDWHGTLEVHYENEVVVNDSDVWDKVKDIEDNDYRNDIIEIANKIDSILGDELVL